MKELKLLVILILLLPLLGCEVENAKQETDKSLVIVSDYLLEKDTVLFNSFSKKNKVSIQIRTMDVYDLIGEFNRDRYNVNCDIVMMRSLHSVQALNGANVLHSIHEIIEKQPSLTSASEKYNYIGFGMDPYVFALNPDTTVSIRTYAALKRTNFINTLDEKDFIPMLAPLVEKMSKADYYSWIKEVKKHETSLDNLNRYQAKRVPMALTTYHRFHTEFKKDSILSSYTKLVYPNSHSTGTFYNLRTMCIIDQAENYTTALAFISAYLTKEQNRRLCEELNIKSSLHGVKDFRSYTTEPENLIQYYSMVARILSKLE